MSSSQALPNPIHFPPQIPVSTTSNPVSVTSSVSLLSLSQAAPTTVVNAAASLTSALQSGLGHNHNYGYSALTIDQLRRDPVLVTQAANVLGEATRNVPPLQAGPFSQAPANLQTGVCQVNIVDQLYQATTINKQLRCFEFAACAQFSYRSQLKQENCNATSFAYGAFKHLEACKIGLIPNISEAEFLARIRHLKNVFEIACLSSNLSQYCEPSWSIAREYDTRVISDIESGSKSWESLSVGSEPDSIYCAKETVENRLKQSKKVKDPKKNVDVPRRDSKKQACTTYNTHRSSDGCYWESQNRGETCVYDHYCSWCKEHKSVIEKHKAFNCPHKSD